MNARASMLNHCGNDNYAVVGSDKRVEAWSTKRLPFEPSGWLRDLRGALRESIRRLVCPSERVLHGFYTSAIRDACDTENILFYNVGTRSFEQPTRRGLRFERAFSDPPAPPRPLDSAALHYQRYDFCDRTAHFSHWDQHRTIARWGDVDIDSAASLFSPSVVWLLMKSTEVVMTGEAPLNDALFGLSVTIRVPQVSRSRPINPAAIMKAVFDGIIASFYLYEGNHLTEVSSRLGARLTRDPAEIAQYLTNSGDHTLGRRPLLHLRADGVQWNPADDQCVAGELLIEQGDTTSFELSGQIFAVASHSPAAY